MERTILHCDANSFYASVELADRPWLKGRPVAVGGNSNSRHGIILAKNEEAKRYAITTGETIFSAKKKCPDLIILPPCYEKYAAVSHELNRIYESFTDRVEPFGIDESWLDVTGTTWRFGTGEEIADRIRAIARERFNITLSVGVSFNKVMAKLGSDYKKPDATTVITRRNMKDIVHPLPVTDLLYVGRSARKELSKLEVYTIGDLAAYDRQTLIRILGKNGGMIQDFARGIDDSPVAVAGYADPPKSIGDGLTFKRDLVGEEDIKLGVCALADCVAARMRRHNVCCGVIAVTIRDPAFNNMTRQRRLPYHVCTARELYDAAMEIIRDEWEMTAPIRMLTITGMGLTHGQVQRSMLAGGDRRERLERSVDALRGRFGAMALFPAAIINNDLGIGGGRGKQPSFKHF